MKVLLQCRLDLHKSGGGDKVQIENTAKELINLGVDVEISDNLQTDYSMFDVIHVFQMDWTPESYLFAKKAKKFGKPLVLSPIHHSVQEVTEFDSNYVFDFRRISKFLFKEQHNRDTFKNVYKSVFDLRKSYPTLLSIFVGLKKMHKTTLTLADAVLVQTELEAQDLMKTYETKINWKKVVNGVGDNFLNFDPTKATNPLQIKDYLICVGRIEARKNQLNIIKAAKLLREDLKKDIHLVFIGVNRKIRHPEYTGIFTKELAQNPWIHHVEKVPYTDLLNYYHFAKVCVSASWFETTGLTSLEALFCGTNAVAAGERAKEYLGDIASYCKPSDAYSIYTAIKTEYLKPRPLQLPQQMLNYTWKNAAKQTLEVYNNIL